MSKKKFINSVTIQGYLYDHDLKAKESGPNSKNPGTPFINGSIKIATDEDLTNIIEIHYSYVTPTFGTGPDAKENPNYAILLNIANGNVATVMSSDKESAMKLQATPSIDLNDFPNKEKEIVSYKRLEGGFIRKLTVLDKPENERAVFEADVLINGCKRMEADEEKGLPEKLILKLACFNYKKELLPMDMSVLIPGAMDYFESLEPSQKNPVLTKIRGKIVSQTVIKKTEEESAWGEIIVRTSKSSHRDYVVDWAQREPYEFDNEETLLASELQEMIQNRELHKADVRKRDEEYRSKQGGANFGVVSTAAASSIAKGSYNF